MLTLLPVGPLGVATQWWSFAGHLNLTICAKACFELVPDNNMRLVEPEPMRQQEELGLPGVRVIAPADVLPQLTKPEVTLAGSARPSERTGSCTVGLAIVRGSEHIISKRLQVFGDRKGELPPKRFERMYLSYDRAYGGIGYQDNPMGIGHGTDEKPNIVDPHQPDRVAGLAPIPSAFGRRKQLLKLNELTAKRLTAAVVELPERFDWSYYHAAPEDQRVASITGDEWILLENMHPKVPLLRSRLPSIRAAARVYGQSSPLIPDFTPLRAESLHIDADKGRCSLVWRASFPVTDAPKELCIAVATAIGDHAFQFPPDAAAAFEYARNNSVAPAAPAAGSGLNAAPARYTLTAAVSPGDPRLETLPFDEEPAGPTPKTWQGQVPGAPWSAEKPTEVQKPRAGRETITLRDGGDDWLAKETNRHVEEARAKAEAEAEKKAKANAAEDAERRREAEATRFAKEQAGAREEEKRRVSKQAAKQKEEVDELMDDLYGTFTQD
jgi:hypothetical protein